MVSFNVEGDKRRVKELKLVLRFFDVDDDGFARRAEAIYESTGYDDSPERVVIAQFREEDASALAPAWLALIGAEKV